MVLFGGALLLILAFGIDSSAYQPAEKQSNQKVLNIQRPNGCQYDNGVKNPKNGNKYSAGTNKSTSQSSHQQVKFSAFRLYSQKVFFK